MKILSKIKYSFIILLFIATSSNAGDAINVGEVQVTALRADESVIKIPGNVTIITSEDITNSTATTVQDLLRDVDGIIVRDLYGTGTKTTVDVRGFTAGMNTAVLVDGRKLNEIDLSGVEWNMIALDNVDRIEIIRSGGSVLYGDNANGAVINIITKKGKQKTPELRVDGSLGSYGEDREEVSLSGATDTTSYYFSARNTKTDGYRDNSEFRSEDFSGRVFRDLSSNSYIDISGGTHRDHQGFPSTLTKAELKADRSQASSLVDDADYDQHYYSVTVGVSEDNTELDITFSSNNREYDSVIFGGDTNSDISKDEIKIKVTNRDKLFGKKNLLVFGMDHYSADAKNSSVVPSYSIDTVTELEKVEDGFYIQDEIYLTDKIIAIAGYRQSTGDFVYSVQGTSFGFPISGTGSELFSEESYKSGLTFNYSDKSKVFIAYSKGYRLPSTDESFSAFSGSVTPLKAESNSTSEIGIVHSIGSRSIIGLTYYYMKVENELFYNDLTYNNENIDNTIHEGVEVSFSTKASDSIKLKGSWSYNEARNDSGVHDGKDLPLVPKNSGALELVLNPVDSITVSMDANFVDRKVVGSDYANNADKMEAYTVVNAKLKYELNDMATFFIGADNLFNELYSETAYDYGFGHNLYPAPESRYYGGVNLVF